MCSCSPAPRALFLATSVPSGGWLHGQQCQCGLWGFIWASMHCAETKNCLPGRQRPLFLQPSRGPALAGTKLQQKMKSILHRSYVNRCVPLRWCKREKNWKHMLVWIKPFRWLQENTFDNSVKWMLTRKRKQNLAPQKHWQVKKKNPTPALAMGQKSWTGFSKKVLLASRWGG